MKIALLGPAHPFRGGVVHFNSRLAAELQSRTEHKVDLFYWSKPYPAFLLPGKNPNKDETSTLTFERPGSHILSYTCPLTWVALVKRLRRGRYDVFITHWVHTVHFPVFKVLFAAIRLLTKTKICLITHNCLPHEPLPGAITLNRSVFKMAHRLVVHSRSEANQVKRVGISPGHIVTAFHPICDFFPPPPDTLNFIRSDLGLRDKVLLFFGFIRPYKGLDCLLEAFCTLAPHYPDVSLLIAGEYFGAKSENYDKNDRLIRFLPPGDPVRAQIVWIDRYISNEEVGRYFSVADALVAPYLSATQSGVIQVAYAFEKPVIASDLPAFRECVNSGESGYLFSAGNARELKEKMALFLKTPILTERVRCFRQRFSWDRYVDLLFDSVNHRTKLKVI
jgi:glycosyltransferase involved in cell wall biosynthesis